MVDTAGVEFADAANLFFKLILRQSESFPFFILALGFAPRVSTLSGYTRGYCGTDRTTEDQLFLNDRKIASTDIRVHAGEGYLLMMWGHAIEREVPAHLISGLQLKHFARAIWREVQVDTWIVVVRRAEVPAQRVGHGRHRIEQTDEVNLNVGGPAEFRAKPGCLRIE